MRFGSILLTGWLVLSSPVAFARAEAPFAVRVVDEQTGRGVPLVELKGTPDEIYVTDSNGYVAIDDPTLMGQKVYFHVKSHGYEHSADGFGYRGESVDVRPGGEATIKVKRINIAQRLYRITGAGIYRDSVKLGKGVPIEKPLINGLVCGQDTVQNVVVGDTVYWFWGDTDRLAHPLGQFNTSGAVSKLPKAGGLAPSKGVNLEYFVGDDGFSRPMFKRENGILIWVHGAFGVEDTNGKMRVLTHYSRRKGLSEELSAGLAVLNDETNVFEHVLDYTNPNMPFPRGQSFRYRDGGEEYIAFATPYPIVRVKADWKSVMDSKQWGSFTPLKEASSWKEGEQAEIDRGADGKAAWAWKRNTAVVDRGAVVKLIEKGQLKDGDNWYRTLDAADGKPVQMHAGSVKWNEHRKRWILIAHSIFSGPSLLGEVWYSESKKPEGPFEKAVKIVTHDNYSFYNVTQHDFFDEDGGRTVYFEGTYTATFTKDAVPTPWYDYNQIMYSLDLDDPRLKAAFAE
jgi:hypothetical protein